MALSKVRISIFVIVVLYLYIYNPILRSGLAFGTVLYILSFIYAISNFSIVIRYLNYCKKEILLSILITVYIGLVCIFIGIDDFALLKIMILWILFSTIVPIFIVRVVLSCNKKIFFEDIILDVGFLASIISCFALFSPSFNNFLRNIQQDISNSGGLFLEQMSFRGFGFAHYLTSSYGFVQGLFASLCLLKIDKKHKRYILYFLTISLSVIINARTGMFPIAMTILYFLLSSFARFEIKNIVLIVLLGGLSYFALFKVLDTFPDLHDFFFDFFEQLYLMFIDENYELENSAYSKMLVFPDTTSGLIFGEGHDIFGETHVISSDIGYVNQIFIGGILFVSGLLLYQIIFFYKLIKRSTEKVFPTIFFLSILVYNYKGSGFYHVNPYFNLWMLYYYVLVHNQFNSTHPIRIS